MDVPVSAAGVLVGAGSYGRVFAGKLGVQDVAIKVLHHDDAAAQQVASEVCLCIVTPAQALTATSSVGPGLLSLAHSRQQVWAMVFSSHHGFLNSCCCSCGFVTVLHLTVCHAGVYDDAVPAHQPCQGLPLHHLGHGRPLQPPHLPSE